MDTDDISGNIAVLHNLVSLSNKFIPASLFTKYQYWLTRLGHSVPGCGRRTW